MKKADCRVWGQTCQDLISSSVITGSPRSSVWLIAPLIVFTWIVSVCLSAGNLVSTFLGAQSPTLVLTASHFLMVIISAFLSPDLHNCNWNCLLGSCTGFSQRTRLYCIVVISMNIFSRKNKTKKKQCKLVTWEERQKNCDNGALRNKTKTKKTPTPTVMFVLLKQVWQLIHLLASFSLLKHMHLFLSANRKHLRLKFKSEQENKGELCGS